MLNFGMKMPLLLMGLYGSLMILIILVVRALLKKHLPAALLPILWGLVLVRLLVPFSVSGPFAENISAPDIVLSWNEAVSEQPQLAVLDKGGAAYAAHSYEGGAIGPATDGFYDTAARGGNAAALLAGALGLGQSPTAALLALVYLAGAAVTLAVLLRRRHVWTRRLGGSLPVVENQTIQAVLRENALPGVRVYTSDVISSPLVRGVFRPRIYLPTGMDFADTRLLRDVLGHECTHVRRGDNAVKAVMLAALCLHWFNLLVWGMARWLCADLESSCDAATLRRLAAADPGARKHYAESLLSMAVAGGKASLLYSAFSKTEVERRIRGVLRYKKAGAAALAAALLLGCGTAVFAAGVPAPFNGTLYSGLNSAGRWNADVDLTWDAPRSTIPEPETIRVVYTVLGENDDAGRTDLAAKISEALASSAGLPPSTFRVDLTLSLTEAEKQSGYAAQGITSADDGSYLYQREPVRIFLDPMLRSVMTRWVGTVDITVERDDGGNITGVTALHAGDPGFADHTRNLNAG